MSNLKNSGQFQSTVLRKRRFVRKDLPCNPHEAIAFLQRHDVLPLFGPRGEFLEVRDFGNEGDSFNANLKFYEKGS